MPKSSRLQCYRSRLALAQDGDLRGESRALQRHTGLKSLRSLRSAPRVTCQTGFLVGALKLHGES
jgi:hypothetical protein